MKIPCDLILDLLPLYHNNLCSECSDTIIEKHLEACEKCNAAFHKMGEVIDIPQTDADILFEQVLKKIYKC